MDYQRNHGDGLDCYLVGKTLGGGALVPAIGGKLCIGDNYATQEHICDGPIRTSARFTNETVDIDGTPVTMIREMSLDAGSRFVKWVTVFEAPTAEIPVALGAIMHTVIAREDGANYVAFTEMASDTDDPERDGNVSIGLVMCFLPQTFGSWGYYILCLGLLIIVVSVIVYVAMNAKNVFSTIKQQKQDKQIKPTDTNKTE